jgi:hypothetical protein
MPRQDIGELKSEEIEEKESQVKGKRKAESRERELTIEAKGN